MFFVVFLFIQFIFYSQASYICPPDTINITDDSTSVSQCYYFSTNSNDSFKAENFCNTMEGHLASIHDGLINSNFTDIANENIDPSFIAVGVWLGLNEAANGIWTWIDGTPFDYKNWATDEPINRKINCAFLNLKDGSWISDGCSAAKPFSCIVKPILVVTTSTKNPNPPTTKIATTTTTKKNATTKTLPSTTTISPLPIKDPNSITKWLIIGGVLIVFLFIFGFILRYFIRIRYRQKRFIELQKIIKNKMELSPLEVKLSHDERLLKQIDSKNIIIDFNTLNEDTINKCVQKMQIYDSFCF